jgi:hypothetical protein
MFMLENMDIKDGFATSSKEHLRSLVHVPELDEITSNGGKDRSATKEHPRGLKRKRPNFMREEPPSWTRGSSTLKPWRRRHWAGREPFAPGGYPQVRERGGRSLEGDQPPRRKHRQVEKKEDTVRRETMINGTMSSTLMG